MQDEDGDEGGNGGLEQGKRGCSARGDVVLAIAEGTLTADDLVPVREVVTRALPPPPERPLVFKSVGMSWQDLVVAEAVVRTAAADCP